MSLRVGTIAAGQDFEEIASGVSETRQEFQWLALFLIEIPAA
jgi:hypothetical protein